MAYFRTTEHERAVKRLASQASPAFLKEILFELADRCEGGWIVSRAAMRADAVSDAVWPIIRSKHPRPIFIFVRGSAAAPPRRTRWSSS